MTSGGAPPPAGPDGLRPALTAFLALYADGRFFDAHEELERAWRRSGDPDMVFAHGLIQLAVSQEHHRRGNPVGARRQLDKAWDKLRRFPGGHLGVDIAAVRAAQPGLAAAYRAWEAGGPAPPLEPPAILPAAAGERGRG